MTQRTRTDDRPQENRSPAARCVSRRAGANTLALASGATELSKICFITATTQTEQVLVLVEVFFVGLGQRDKGILGVMRGGCQGSFGKKVEKTPGRLSQ